MMGKVGKVIIDSSCTDNIVLEEAANMLNMKIIPHSNPYKVTWVNKGQQKWVEFSIRKYKDNVLCNFLPIDACHLLLGRP